MSTDPVNWRGVAVRTVTVVACLVVLLVLVAPGELGVLTPLAFLRIPIDALLAIGLMVVLAPRARRIAAWTLGITFGLLAVVKIISLGFSMALDRSFDPVYDWPFLEAGVDFLAQSSGRAAAIGAVIGALLLTAAVVTLVALAFVRTTRLAVRHRPMTIRVLVAGALAWVVCLVAAVQLVPNVPVASRDYFDRLARVNTSLRDREAFNAASAVDAFAGTPNDQLLTALRGKDMALVFIESYGRVALDDPSMGPQIRALLDDGSDRLRAAGFGSRSGFLTSPTAGGGSWLAHATMLSGLWVNNQQRYRQLLAGDRLTLTAAFQKASWRTVAVMPGTNQQWPEGGQFFGYDRIYTATDLGYHGPRFSFSSMPDQFTLAAFQRSEEAGTAHSPLMAMIPLTSSHGPWNPVPPLVDWNTIGDGSAFQEVKGAGAQDAMLGSDRVNADYERAIAYSLQSLVSYVEKYGDENLVLVFLGDHQPSTAVTGTKASRDVPITIVARDPAVLERVSGWGWTDGLRPGPQAPVWRMDTFRDRFLTAFG
ncbi:hypothetical protein Rhe02_60640 [Rhizocola hellebori]|uniref:Sulfatase N-terminal domain-containing protein n=1 Tax=Rhizocola hellebori TaxID=1392758 RepID=A0A8J3QDE5_9ACTN|nr:sulfatase-like hydrolase/transferase [Rhizocola hellebori]GIH07997.1 hypothetical protein Rhe02_60640 [Rhizocola hellebori]